MLCKNSAKLIPRSDDMRYHRDRCRFKNDQSGSEIFSKAQSAPELNISEQFIHRSFAIHQALIVAAHSVAKYTSFEMIVTKRLYLALKGSLVDIEGFIPPFLRPADITQRPQAKISSGDTGVSIHSPKQICDFYLRASSLKILGVTLQSSLGSLQHPLESSRCII
jgi:hypothetical protein